jgi:hypothetical protein
MQTAPSVDFPVGRFYVSAWMGWVLSALSMAGFLCAVLWGYMGLETSLAFGFLWIALAFFTRSQLSAGQVKCWLSWNDAQWRVHSLQVADSEAAWIKDTSTQFEIQGIFSMQVHLDLQQCLFVSMVNLQGERHWFWVFQKSFPERWHGFRCAVYSTNSLSIL